MKNKITCTIQRPTNISKRYDFGNGQFVSHTLNGIYVYILPDSIEGRLISFITSYQHTNFYYQSTEDFKKLCKKFQKWKDSKGFDWD